MFSVGVFIRLLRRRYVMCVAMVISVERGRLFSLLN